MRSTRITGLLFTPRLAVGLLLLVGALLPGPLFAQTTPTPTITPVPAGGSLVVITRMVIDVEEPGSGRARLILEIEEPEEGWPSELEVTVALPEGLTLETAEVNDNRAFPGPGDAPNDVRFIVRPPTSPARTQVLELFVSIDPDAPAELAPATVRLRDIATGRTAIAELAGAELDDLESARPVAGDDTQQAPPSPGDLPATAPAVTEEPAPTAVAAQAEETTPTTSPPATSAAPPAATEVLPAVVSDPTAVAPAEVDDAAGDATGDEPAGGLSVSDVLWILLIVGGALLFLAVILLILLRLFRRPKAPPSRPIAMRPGPATPEATVPAAAAEAISSAPVAGPSAPPAAATTAATLAAVPAPSRGPAYLTLAADPSRRFEIAGERFTIGRADGNSLVVDDSYTEWDTVSRFHAAIYMQAGKTIIEDLNSHNGVWVNGQAVPKIALSDGAEVGIGAVTFIFHAGDVAGEQGGSAK